jgi:hypothetical protein
MSWWGFTQVQGQVGGSGPTPQSAPTTVPAPPAEEQAAAIAQLCAMGWEEPAVRAALQASGWSLDAAANRLMG